MPWDPDSGETFGAWARGGAPLGGGRSVDVVTGERTWVTRDQTTEETTEGGSRVKRVRDQAGNDVVYETDRRGRERKHVRINLP